MKLICTAFLFFTCFLVAHTLVAQPKTKARFTFLALGDSYTIGESVAENERWPNQLATLLRSDPAFADRYTVQKPQIIAKTGWTTDELQKGIAEKQTKGNYTLVSLLIGVNNQYRGYPIDMFRKQLRELIAESITYANKQCKHVLVLSIPDWGVTTFGKSKNRFNDVSKQIDIFNAIIREECKKADVHFIDITPISRNTKDQAELIAVDGLHPSGKMYQQWAEQIAPLVKSLY